ncbi:hypothetical protein WA588_002287, partial [Blastocystis sp. NMH]
MKRLVLKNPEESRKKSAHALNREKSVSVSSKKSLEDLLDPDGKGSKGNTPVIGLDCEMVGIGSGEESALARVSIVNYYGYVLYDSFVKPQSKVVDYRTKYSGIRPSDLEGPNVVSLREAQNKVVSLLKNRVVVGHGLPNDFEALMVSHPKGLIRDTAFYEPLMRGKKHAEKLSVLVRREVGEAIQEGEHNSVDDARAALLVYRKHRSEWEKWICEKRKGKKEEVASGE